MINKMAVTAMRLLLLGLCGILGVWATGSPEPVSTNDLDVANVAKFALNEIDQRTNSNYRSRVKQIVSAKRQLVNGFNWFITFDKEKTNCLITDDLKLLKNCIPNGPVARCDIKVYSTFHNEYTLNQYKCNSPGSLLGGITEEDIEDPLVKKAAEFATVQANNAVNSLFFHKLVTVKSVTKQVVAGLKYKIKFTIGETECRKNRNQLNHCPLTNNAGKVHAMDCEAVVIFKAWETPQYTMDKPVECKDVEGGIQLRKKRSLTVNMDQESKDEISHKILFKDFKARYNKVYKSSQEEADRYAIFRKNMETVRVLQATERGSGRYGATQFADLSEEEFRKNYLSPVWKKDDSLPRAKIPNAAPPPSFDWRKSGAVTEVKNQGSCGSCWAFSTTGNIEGQWFIKKKQLVSLSEQELVDCDKVDQGCGGGLPSNAYKEIIRLGGLEGESDYPYRGSNDKCTLDRSKIKVFINGSVSISKDETMMAAWLAQNGPISIGINAFAMQFYFGGISNPWKVFCNPAKLDHGVLIVGYGVKGTEPFWIVKNSWGPSWGEQGYYLVYRGDGACGLNTMCTSAVVN
ncbi:cathepsin L-like [Tubulanus polymorphus]|uniref:cathepsin L-like n=1 Tax=Tubulanus polymorphus TaxID=672921 RepID=UPI003DA518D2